MWECDIWMQITWRKDEKYCCSYDYVEWYFSACCWSGFIAIVCLHIQEPIHMHMQEPIHIRCIHTHVHTRMCTHACAHTHVHTHTHTHTHTEFTSMNTLRLACFEQDMRNS